MNKEEKKEGMVRDLIEKEKRGEMTPEEIKQEIYRRGIRYGPFGKYPFVLFLSWLGWGVLCFISLIGKMSIEIEAFPIMPILEPLTRLPTIIFPLIIRYLAVIFALFGLIVSIYATYLRRRRGGVHSEDETIILIKEGPYRIVRHPSEFFFYWFLILLTVFLSEYVPFNILSVIGNLLLFLGSYYPWVGEERLNILKWGEEYRQYQKEVPKFNFILGIWRWAKRKRK